MPSPRKAGATAVMPPLPEAFVARMAARLGTEVHALVDALAQPPPTSIRHNPRKPGGPVGEPVPWCASGHHLTQRPRFTLDPLLHAGAYYVQEAGSMLLERALAAAGLIGTDAVALDLCAAPGGKSTHLLSLLGPRSVVLCNEVDARRHTALLENVYKWGAPNACVTRLPAGDFAAMPHFDLVVLDAPCSGEGLMRREPVARTQWSPWLVQRCSTLQAALLEHAWQALRPGGTLVYCTCTWAEEEDEGLLHRFLEGHAATVLPIDPLHPGPVRGAIGITCMPHRCKAEGFFIAALRKPGTAAPWDAGGTIVLERGRLRPSGWNALPVALRERIDRADGALPVLLDTPGGPAPHPAAAYCREALDLLQAAVPFTTVDLDHATALAFLRGEAIAAREARGHALMRFDGLGLGWARGAGNRWNNRHPAPWRIRTRRTDV